jgi:hypothetical protein
MSMLQRTKPVHSPNNCAYNIAMYTNAYLIGICVFRFGFNALARNQPEISNWHGVCEGRVNFP